MQCSWIGLNKVVASPMLAATIMLCVSCTRSENTQSTDAGSDQKQSTGVLVWEDYKAKPDFEEGRRDLTPDEASAIRHFLTTATRTEIQPGELPTALWDVQMSIDGLNLEIHSQSVLARKTGAGVFRYTAPAGVLLIKDRPGHTGKPDLSPLVTWWRQCVR